MNAATTNVTSRRRFLGGAAALGLAAGVLPGRAAAARRAPAAARRAGVAPSRYQLELAGQPRLLVVGAEGGNAYRDVVTTPVGRIDKKQLGNLRYEDISLRLPLTTGRPMSEWLRTTMDGKQLLMDGALIESDYDYNVVERREFTRALITEIGFPALDASDKDPGSLTVKLAIESLRAGPGKGTTQPQPKTKLWLPANFRLDLDGIDTSRVSKIETFTVKQAVGAYGKKLEYPNLAVTFSGPAPADLLKWHDDFLVRGNSGDDREKKGAIVFLTPDLGHELGRVSLTNVGISNLGKRTDDTAITRFTASFYVEQMSFTLAETDA